jgi:hypothetical protein
MSLSLARRVIEYARRGDRRRTVFGKCFSRLSVCDKAPSDPIYAGEGICLVKLKLHPVQSPSVPGAVSLAARASELFDVRVLPLREKVRLEDRRIENDRERMDGEVFVQFKNTDTILTRP